MEEWGLAAPTIDRRLSTVCGFYRFAHIDGRIGSNPAEYVRRPQIHPSDARGLDRSELGTFLAAADHYDAVHQALAVLLGLNGLRVSEACETNVEDLAVERGHRILRITGKGNTPGHEPRSASALASGTSRGSSRLSAAAKASSSSSDSSSINSASIESVDTGVFSASISRRRRARFEPQVGLMAGQQIFLAAVTVAELRYGVLVAGSETTAASGSSSRSQRRQSSR